jgi:coproporphyrinogen III oxidase-like Fe-S oxidoreductase
MPSVSSRLVEERAIYARAAAALGHAEPSSLLQHLGAARTRSYTAREIAEEWQDAPGRKGDEAALNLYLHVPFCKSICSFCNYKRLRVSSREALDEFVAFVIAEAKHFAPAFAGIPFGALYVGGGTPSVLSAEQLARVLGALHESFAFRERAQKTFEFDPMVMTEDRHRVLRDLRFTRFSFGIQSADVSVNQLHNRGPQSKAHLERQFELLSAQGAKRANVDFLFGLHGTSPSQLLAEMEEVMTRHRPSEISAYFLQPTHDYLTSHFGGDHARFRAFLADFEREVPAALEAISARTGYEVRSAGKHVIRLGTRTPLEGPGAGEYGYCDVSAEVHRPLFLLGLGDSARSRIFGRLEYRAEHDHGDTSPDRARYLGVATTPPDEMFAYLALVLRDGDVVSRPLFRRTFGADVVEVLARPIEKLVALGAATVDDDAVRFVEQSREERLRDLLFFLPRERRTQLTVPRAAAGPASEPADEAEVRAAVAPYVEGAPVIDGWQIGSIGATGVSVRRTDPPSEILVKLFRPAGARASFRSTARYDVQYHVVMGGAFGTDVERPLRKLVGAIEQNERR